MYLSIPTSPAQPSQQESIASTIQFEEVVSSTGLSQKYNAGLKNVNQPTRFKIKENPVIVTEFIDSSKQVTMVSANVQCNEDELDYGL